MRGAGLDERLVIEQQTQTTGPYGDLVIAWQPVATVWAKAMHQRGDESFIAAQTNATRTVKFKMRYRDGINPTMRITWRRAQYDIHDVDESLRRDGELWITGTFNSART